MRPSRRGLLLPASLDYLVGASMARAAVPTIFYPLTIIIQALWNDLRRKKECREEAFGPGAVDQDRS
ncbi:hypothetical protein CU048_15130 [Beijerinckiaceae bacterium]|nr:hypothetical protein CU048_15130 [Beijerinckiaceae bacterium]